MSYDFNIIVNAEMPSISADGFGTILAISTELDIDYQILEDLKDLEVEGLEETAYEKLIQSIFSQSPAPKNVIAVGKADGSIKEIIEEQLDINDDFFFIVADKEFEVADIEYVETLEKVAFTRVAEVDTFEELAETGYENAVSIYSPAETGVTGATAVSMGYDVGGKTAHALMLDAVTPVSVNNADKKTILDNNGNIYVRANKRNRLIGGKTSSGQWLDVVLGKYWIKFTLEQRLDNLITNVNKIPYNNDGVGTLAGVVSTVMSEAKERGIIDSFEVHTKDVNEISAAEKSTRQYNYLKATGYLQGAIHGGDITINLVYKEAEIDE